jgi:hypothetical protein
MAISTEREELLKFYEQKIKLDKQQLIQVETIESGYTIDAKNGDIPIRVWGPSELISYFDVPIENLDQEIVSINDEIKELQNSVLSIGTTANSVGCGTTAWSPGFSTVTVLEDRTRYKGYSYTSPNPFAEISGSLNTGNSGIGTYTFINQVAIGSYFSPIDVCYAFTCTSGQCEDYADQIVDLNTQIDNLQTERDDLIVKVNDFKIKRIDFELQNYAYTASKQKLNTQIGIASAAIEFLNDPENEQWF